LKTCGAFQLFPDAGYYPAMPGDPSASTGQILEILSCKRRVLVATHVRPDGDALGTATAMCLGLRQKGIESRLLLFDPPPDKYAFLVEENQISWFNLSSPGPAEADLHRFEALLVVDTGTWSQLPGLKEWLAGFSGPKLVVDHHLTQENWADARLVDSEAAAAGEIAFDLLRQWGVALDRPMATALFVAIATDTGWFQFANTRPGTLRLAASLLEMGVDADGLYRLVYQNERPQRLAIMALALQSLELSAGGRLAMMSLSKEDFARSGAASSDTENLVNLPMQVGSVQVSVLLTEEPDAAPVRVNLRSKGAVDVAAVAQRFQGGGHARAAGLKLTMSLPQARLALAEALRAVMPPTP
jgi:bifunctional oligoribonuclease and PAP phosphatase NrnA